MSEGDTIAKLRNLYPHEPLLLSFRNHLRVIEAGGFDAARAALERHIEWKAKLAPFHDEIGRLRAEVERMRPVIDAARAWNRDRIPATSSSTFRASSALAAALAVLDAGKPQ